MTLFRLYAFTVALCLTLASFLAPVLHAQVISTAPQSQNATAGATATFTVAATGAGSLSYQWQFNGSALANGAAVSGATSATLARWFGVSATNLSVAFPNIGRFANPNLGFL